MHYAIIAFDNGHLAAESAHPLRQFQSDVATAEYQEMFRDFAQLKSFDVGERLRLGQSRDGFKRGVRTSINHYISRPNLARAAVGQCDFQSSRANEPSRTDNEIGPASLVVLQMDVH